MVLGVVLVVLEIASVVLEVVLQLLLRTLLLTTASSARAACPFKAPPLPMFFSPASGLSDVGPSNSEGPGGQWMSRLPLLT